MQLSQIPGTVGSLRTVTFAQADGILNGFDNRHVGQRASDDERL
jgi:hypothetical protein